ncbi:MAG: metal-sensing transcriptional repressor [Treponema sp.]|nr:metal-sensing transcriptional repressor [Treponema sp.]
MAEKNGTKKKLRSPEEIKALTNRLNRLEGQVNGIKKMLESDVHCPAILLQVSAVHAALNSFSKELLSQHIRTCVTHDLRSGKEGAVEAFVATVQKLMR